MPDQPHDALVGYAWCEVCQDYFSATGMPVHDRGPVHQSRLLHVEPSQGTDPYNDPALMGHQPPPGPFRREETPDV